MCGNHFFLVFSRRQTFAISEKLNLHSTLGLGFVRLSSPNYHQPGELAGSCQLRAQHPLEHRSQFSLQIQCCTPAIDLSYTGQGCSPTTPLGGGHQCRGVPRPRFLHSCSVYPCDPPEKPISWNVHTPTFSCRHCHPPAVRDIASHQPTKGIFFLILF